MAVDLVTGGGGYLGSYVTKALLEQGREARVLDINKTTYCPEEADFVKGDIRDPDTVKTSLKGVERVFHIAFVQSLSKLPEEERYAIDIGGTENLLQESARAGVQRFVFASTIEIYGTRPPFPCYEDAPKDQPVGWYGRHKWIAEQAVWRAHKELGLACAALRLPTICGRGFYNHRPLLFMMDRILAGRTMAVIGDGSTPGDFVLLEDAVQAFLLAAANEGAVGEPFNVSAKGCSTQRDVVEAMVAAVGSESKIIRVPAWLARVALVMSRWLRIHDLPAYQDDYLFHPNHYAIDKAVRILGYEPKATAAQAAAALIRGYREDREYVKARAANY